MARAKSSRSRRRGDRQNHRRNNRRIESRVQHLDNATPQGAVVFSQQPQPVQYPGLGPHGQPYGGYFYVQPAWGFAYTPLAIPMNSFQAFVPLSARLPSPQPLPATTLSNPYARSDPLFAEWDLNRDFIHGIGERVIRQNQADATADTDASSVKLEKDDTTSNVKVEDNDDEA
ncbi:hypothetical protein PG993_010653 [Apiospora rasikravindrae]|uniref:Uncharacterized protein n=1 Tax=Apiospora rasikravindrae TaxID=990691 RepID=A0ABR1SQ90_9PEZI